MTYRQEQTDHAEGQQLVLVTGRDCAAPALIARAGRGMVYVDKVS